MQGKRRGWLMLGMMIMIVGMGFGAPSSKVTNKTTSVTNKTSSATPSSSQKTSVGQKSTSKTLDTHYKPGTFAMNVGIDFWAFTYGGFAVSPGVEWMFGQYAIENVLPFDFGVAVQGFYYTYGYDYSYYYGNNYSWRYNYLGAGIYATVHFGPKKILHEIMDGGVPQFMQKLDFYAGVGLFLRNYWVTFSDPDVQTWYNQYYRETVSPLGFATMGGVTYFLTDSIGIRLDSSYYGYFGATVSLVLKF